MRKLSHALAMVLLGPLSAFADNFYVSQSGSGSQDGSSASNSWSLSKFSSASGFGGADTVIFSGSFSSGVTLKTSGSGDGSSRLTYDFSNATLNGGSPRISINGAKYINVKGGTFGSGDSELISFNGQSNAVTISDWSYTGGSTSVALFLWANSCTNLIVENNTVDNVGGFIAGDSTLTHDVVVRNNFARTSHNTTDQTDIIRIGDVYNLTIEGNKFVQQTEGATSMRHNDCIQTYKKGGSNAGMPYGWVIRYNWIELDVRSGSGDTSWLMLENMTNSGSTDACKIYSNVFIGDSTDTASNNGTVPNSNDASAVFRVYNNTFIRKNGPDNTIRFLSPGKLHARNNAGYASSSGMGTYLSWSMSAATAWDYNWFYNFGAGSNYVGSHGGTSDPKFTNYAGNDFSLSSNSPLRGAGDSSIGSEYNQGIAPGATWPKPDLVTRTSWDIGAYVAGGTTTPAVVAPSNAKTSIQTK